MLPVALFCCACAGGERSHGIDNSVSVSVVSNDNLNCFRVISSFDYNEKMSGVRDLLDKETEVAYNKDCL